jgi:hypothetical protein
MQSSWRLNPPASCATTGVAVNIGLQLVNQRLEAIHLPKDVHHDNAMMKK